MIDLSNLPLRRSAKGILLPSMANVAMILDGHASCEKVLAYDSFREIRVKKRDTPWGAIAGEYGNVDTPQIMVWLEKEADLQVNKETVEGAVAWTCEKNKFDPLKSMITSTIWDGDPRVSSFFPRYFGTKDDPYTRGLSGYFLRSMIARAIYPGCKVDNVLILEGSQGLGKSSAIAALAGDGFFSDTALDFKQKDAMHLIRGIWLQEIAELDALYRTEQTTVKAFITKTHDRFRPSHMPHTATFQRRTVFIGSTNECTYLQDMTGARRFWPIRCGKIDRKGIVADRLQLFAEAYAQIRAGEVWYYSEDSEFAALARVEQAARLQDVPWVFSVTEWLAARSPRERALGLSSSRILTEALNLPKERHSNKDAILVSKIMHQLGWEKTPNPVACDGGRARVYMPPKNERLHVVDFDAVDVDDAV